MIAYLDLPSGISGDMFLGCLVDAGWSVENLRFTIAQLRLPAQEWSVECRQVMKGPLRATLVDVMAAEGQHHRHLADIQKILEASDLPKGTQEKSLAVFRRLAEAEAKVHGTTLEKIHFHEVGAIDAIIDVVGTVAGLAALGITKVYASALPMGAGWANTEHGKIPLPAPATLELLAAVKAPTRPAPGPGEWVTPTGAALVAELAEFAQPMMTLEKIGTGAGQKETPWPNVARMWLGQVSGTGHLVQLETNIDDMNPQLYAAVSDKLFSAGAKDVWFTPIQMKKNRPGVMLSALGPATREAALSQIILEETTTLGVRVQEINHRHEARREMRDVETAYGKMQVKIKWMDTRALGATPEYEDCRALAEANHVSIKVVYEAAMAAGHELLKTLK